MIKDLYKEGKLETLLSKYNIKDLEELENALKKAKELEIEKYYEIIISQYSIFARDYLTYIDYIKTNDIYHWIGYKYCNTIEQISRIDYLSISKDTYDKGERKTFYKGEEVKYK